ncbi:MAG TPA: RagB/SusD family nutrient uptake outer membrane protein [Phnomibacter sp.]|nr:RagB/SusD family nutrient uptake outer membrane protein [Phnomibacter sp.]
MKRAFFRNIATVTCGAALLLASSCSKKLEEKPYTVFTIEYLKSPAGLQTSVVTLYSSMRYLYGPNGALNTTNSGTDEWSLGDQGAGSGLDCGAYNLNPSNGDILTPWNRSFNNINLANGILEFIDAVDMDASLKKKLTAEAHFFRGLYYFGLVQQFGAVPLDLGSGDLVFNQSPFQGFNRLVPDLLKKNYDVIIEDFKYAAANLTAARPNGGGFYIYQATAYHMLAKAYLFRGYSSVKQATDFKSAWDAAKYVIDNQASLGTGLLQDYADIHKEGNDYNKEILYSVERIQGSPYDNETNDVSNEFSGKANMSCNWFNSNYQNNQTINGAFPCDRVIQYMRPLRQLAPNPWLYDSAFADKKNDSRYDNSFRTVWLATNNNASASGVVTGDTAFYLAPSKVYADSLRAVTPAKKYRIFDPTQFYLVSRPSVQLYPSLKKYDDTKRTNVNDASGRPFVVSKLSEVYLEAAEAAIKDGRPADALPLIITLRKRAAFRVGLSPNDLAARENVMTNKNTGTPNNPILTPFTAADMTVDFIMDERSRELCGESLRWVDLACRGLLIEYVKTRNRNLVAAPKIQPHHVLRPIPQGQLDASSAIPQAEKKNYQNPGYN